ncbi:fimbria/pilus outer membrane usher protein [Ramlibacter sp. XY19]|uniref:fimbria/pilus outer membrane usher protein n=1 Tax=Ramlibacter paludis TaxID=2908000 RepID=UPI0023DACFDD|nr:fimbria/pilus outer membrane usher protein [Ramlibacter paludis]MCG2594916.1 fimbria/pilus outer membrane usher protein [Ramlibacter paludis]
MKSTSSSRFRRLAAAALLAGVAVGAPAQQGSLDEPVVIQLRPVDVQLNGGPAGNWVLLDRNGVLHATAEALDEWRISNRPAAALQYRGQAWYPLAAIPGFTVQLNSVEQTARINFAPLAFAATRLVQEKSDRPALTASIPSAFTNYDLSYTRSATRGTKASEDLGAVVELGTSGNWGVLTNSMVGRNLTGSAEAGTPRMVRRLETTYSRDFPGRDLTLRIGDTATRPGMWGQAVYYGGIQLARNFGLRPGFITQPLPVLAGVSTAPSSVDLYINDSLRQTSKVPAGPFAIDNFPLLTGSGQARLVVRDVLGRETVIVQDFFSHSSLLEEGLSDWSAELGVVRKNLGLKSADYSQGFGAGLYRLGLSKTLTVETHAEAGTRTRGVGAGLVAALPLQLLGQAAVAASDNINAGSGFTWQSSLARTGPVHSFTLNVQGNSPGYRQVGQDEILSIPYRRQIAASYNLQTRRWGALGAGLAQVETALGRSITTYNANYSIQLGGGAVLTANFVRVRDPQATGGGTSFGVSLLLPLSDGIVTSSNVNHKDGLTEGYVSASKGLTGDTGTSWRALAGYREQEPFVEGGLYLQSTRSLSSVDISQSRTRQTVRLGIQGGLVFADGELFATRRVSDSFAVVEVPGYPDVGISAYGSVVARTDARGRALVWRLLPYQVNDIRLDPTELPIAAEIDSIEQQAVPAARSAVKIVFPVRSGRGALVKIEFDDGQPAPAGAQVEVAGDKEEFFVARRGEAFVTGLQDRNELKLRWQGATCSFTVTLPPGTPDDIARVGPVRCSGIKR